MSKSNHIVTLSPPVALDGFLIPLSGTLIGGHGFRLHQFRDWLAGWLLNGLWHERSIA